MSGSSSEGTCPKCGGDTDVYMDWKPFDIVESECLNCGWHCYPVEADATLEEVNERRADLGMKKLKKLKKRY